MYQSSRFKDKKEKLFQKIKNIFYFNCTCTHGRICVYGLYAPKPEYNVDL